MSTENRRNTDQVVDLNPAIAQRIEARRAEYIGLLETVVTTLGLEGQWEYVDGSLRKVGPQVLATPPVPVLDSEVPASGD